MVEIVEISTMKINVPLTMKLCKQCFQGQDNKDVLLMPVSVLRDAKIELLRLTFEVKVEGH